MMENEWTKEIDRLREEKRVLLDACKSAITAARMDEWEKAGSVRYDAYQQLKDAIDQAERPVT